MQPLPGKAHSEAQTLYPHSGEQIPWAKCEAPEILPIPLDRHLIFRTGRYFGIIQEELMHSRLSGTVKWCDEGHGMGMGDCRKGKGYGSSR